MSEGAVSDTSGSPEPVQTTLPGSETITTSEPAIAPTPEPSSWRDGLSDDLRAHPGLQKYSNVADLAKGFLSQSELVGRKGVLLPKEDDADDQARFYGELGRPDSVDGYDLGDFAPAEGLPWSDNVQSTMISAMHEAGLTNGQVNGVIRAYAESQNQEFQTLTQTIADTTMNVERDLRREYGTSYDAKIDLANRAFALAAGDKTDDIRQMVMADGTSLGDNPALIRMFAKLGESLGEDSLRGDGTRQTFTKSPEQAQNELSALAIDENFDKVLMDKNHPEHQRAVEKRAALYEMAYPDETTPE